jgi:Protein of unknown function (DUF3486)
MEKEQRRKRTNRARTIRGLPDDVRKELDERIAKRDFKNYSELKRWMGLHGCQIATVAVKHHAQKLEGQLEAVRLATAQARGG